MSSPRERAIEALLERRGIAGLFGRPEAAADVAAIEAVVDIVGRDARCTRCQTLDDALITEGARVYRNGDGGLLVVTPDADPEEVERRLREERAVELVEKPERDPVRIDLGDGPEESRDMTGGDLGVTAPHEPLRAVPDETPADEPTDDEAPCASTIFPGVECRDERGRPRPYGHPLPHTGRGPSGSAMTWSTKEGTTDG